MQFRFVVNRILPPIVGDAVRRVAHKDKETDPLQEYLCGGRVPWTAGYHLYKWQIIQHSLSDLPLLDSFQRGGELPLNYGIGIDERCVEYPWLISQLQNGAGVLLDAGSVLNHKPVLDAPTFKYKELHILTLSPEEHCFWQRGISYLFCDLRDIPVRSDYYDSIACLSTLEHVGCDNTLYTGKNLHEEQRFEDYVLVMRELRRVLKPDGSLFLTVPFGSYQNFGWQQQFDRNLLSQAVESFGEVGNVTKRFYRYTAEGWNVAVEQDCTECQYADWRPRLNDPAPTLETDLAAAARSVACISLTKSK